MSFSFGHPQAAGTVPSAARTLGVQETLVTHRRRLDADGSGHGGAPAVRSEAGRPRQGQVADGSFSKAPVFLTRRGWPRAGDNTFRVFPRDPGHAFRNSLEPRRRALRNPCLEGRGVAGPGRWWSSWWPCRVTARSTPRLGMSRHVPMPDGRARRIVPAHSVIHSIITPRTVTICVTMVAC